MKKTILPMTLELIPGDRKKPVIHAVTHIEDS